MPIRNYSTTISVNKSAGMIQGLLAEHGCMDLQISYDSGKLRSVRFSMLVSGRPLWFELVVDVAAMLQAMKNDQKIPGHKCNYDQAERVAWRNKYEWLHLQMAELDAGQARLEQLLLGYAVTNDGRTLYERIQSGNLLQLGTG